MVNRLYRVLKEISLLRLLKIADILDKSNRVIIGARANSVLLIKLIIEDKELLILGIKNPALISIGSILIRNLRDNISNISLISYIIDSKDILIISERGYWIGERFAGVL